MGQAQKERRAILILEDDGGLREFTAILLEESKLELDIIECESAARNAGRSSPGETARPLVTAFIAVMISSDFAVRGRIDHALEVKQPEGRTDKRGQFVLPVAYDEMPTQDYRFFGASFTVRWSDAPRVTMPP